MADADDHVNDAPPEEEEEWLEPIEGVESLPDGPTTCFLGGFSQYQFLSDALKASQQPGSKIVVLKGVYDADAILDTSTLLDRALVGDLTVPVDEIVFTGKLALASAAAGGEGGAAAPPPAAAAPADDDAGDDGKPKAPPKPLQIGHMTFLAGALFAELSDADITDCTFGMQYVQQDNSEWPRSVLGHGLSSVRLNGCRIRGQALAAVYCYPHCRLNFNKCDIMAAVKPPAPVVEARTIRKRPTVTTTVAAPPTVPTQVECEVGLHADDAAVVLKDCTLSGFGIGILLQDRCRGTIVDSCKIGQIASTGILVDANVSANLRKNVVTLCGRETIVIGTKAHPTLRENTFVGDVRVKAGASLTGCSDNVVALGGKVYEDERTFAVKGFTYVATDPTAPKKKKVVADDA